MAKLREDIRRAMTERIRKWDENNSIPSNIEELEDMEFLKVAYQHHENYVMEEDGFKDPTDYKMDLDVFYVSCKNDFTWLVNPFRDSMCYGEVDPSTYWGIDLIEKLNAKEDKY